MRRIVSAAAMSVVCVLALVCMPGMAGQAAHAQDDDSAHLRTLTGTPLCHVRQHTPREMQLRNTTAQRPNKGFDSPVLLAPGTNVLALLAKLYHESGYTREQATYIAHRKLGLPYLEEIELPDVVPGAVLLDPEANPLALLYTAFRESGWSADDAIQHAHSALGHSTELKCDN